MANNVPGAKTKNRSQIKTKKRERRGQEENPSQGRGVSLKEDRNKLQMNLLPYQLKSVCQYDQKYCVRNELRRGRQAVTDLLRLMRQLKDSSCANADNLHQAFRLVMKIIDSFCNSLSMLGSQDHSITGGPTVRSKTSSLSSGGKMRHKTRKQGDSWTQVTSDVINDDGYAWRKYGQKVILNAKHPRSYFKCTNRPHCQALKRVQRIDEEPPLYKITHTGHHTCQKSYSSTSFSDIESSIFFNFDNKNNQVLASLSLSPRIVKGSEECKNQQSGLNPNDLPFLEDMETTKNVQWSLDDYDYLIGSVEFNDLHT